MEIFLFISILIILYGYGGYTLPIILGQFFKKQNTDNLESPNSFHKICIVIAAYNEETCIESKLINTIEIEYPKEYLEIIVVSDGSTDNTFNIVKKFDDVRCFHIDERAGKTAAIDRVMPFITADLIVFTDANTLLNKECLYWINRHFYSPLVGGVAGEKKVSIINNASPNQANQEGVYWKYESFLKKVDSNYYSVVGAAGELYAIRRCLYEFPGKNIILDDFIISMNICAKGYLFKYEPKAYAIELPSLNIKEEEKRKIRIASGSIQAILLLKKLLNIFRYKKLSYLYVSHRVLRWTLIPFLLIVVFLINWLLAYSSNNFLISTLLVLQCIFYGLGSLAFFIPNITSKIFTVPQYFIFMNISQIKGIFNFITGRQSAIWVKAKRISK